MSALKTHATVRRSFPIVPLDGHTCWLVYGRHRVLVRTPRTAPRTDRDSYFATEIVKAAHERLGAWPTVVLPEMRWTDDGTTVVVKVEAGRPKSENDAVRLARMLLTLSESFEEFAERREAPRVHLELVVAGIADHLIVACDAEAPQAIVSWLAEALGDVGRPLRAPA